jgi:hypothetical protein
MGSMWVSCGFVKKEDLRIFMAFDKFVIWNWNGELCLMEVRGVTLEERE